MCGIFLYIGKPCDVTQMKRDFESTRHRGPDNTIFTVRYITIDDKEVMIAHGFHRLCINGLKPEADQPFTLENTIYCTNGEVWNCAELEKSMDY
jgi:asparagine synthetase B (glutamine-hydrolysing)